MRPKRTQLSRNRRAAPPGLVTTLITPEVGKEYEVRNSRKGTFDMRVTAINGEWITGVITNGIATAVLAYNVREVGEEITIRDVHSYFIPL